MGNPSDAEDRERQDQERPPGQDLSDLAWLARAVAGQDDTMTHAACRALLPAYVEAELTGQTVTQLLAAVRRHLLLCADCEAMYLDLLEVALADERGELPLVEASHSLLPSDLPRLTLAAYVQPLAEELVSRLAPSLADDLRDLADVFFPRVEALGGSFGLRRGWGAALGFSEGEPPQALELLAATYAATRNITHTLTSDEIQALDQQGRLTETARRTAEQAARDLGLSQREARMIAQVFADLVKDDRDALSALAAQSQ